MTDYYFDTSALVKLYHDELNTSVVEEIFSNEENQIFISEIACIELYSALYYDE
ncbi:MAG: type II toxin-antitoxin system VapC family toxin [Nitrospirota bacterium]